MASTTSTPVGESERDSWMSFASEAVSSLGETTGAAKHASNGHLAPDPDSIAFARRISHQYSAPGTEVGRVGEGGRVQVRYKDVSMMPALVVCLPGVALRAPAWCLGMYAPTCMLVL